MKTPLQEEAYSLMIKHPDKIIIEHECEHDGEKVRHHYDYNKPFNVMLLCTYCHSKIHFPLEYNNTKLRSCRESLGMPKSVLAAKAQLSHSQITVWEKGKSIPLNSRIRLASVLGVNPNDLL